MDISLLLIDNNSSHRPFTLPSPTRSQRLLENFFARDSVKTSELDGDSIKKNRTKLIEDCDTIEDILSCLSNAPSELETDEDQKDSQQSEKLLLGTPSSEVKSNRTRLEKAPVIPYWDQWAQATAQKRKADDAERSYESARSKYPKLDSTETMGGNGSKNSTSTFSEPTTSTPLQISRSTPLNDVVSLLIQHGCEDITSALDLSRCTEYPISMGGFGDIYRGELTNGILVAVKCMRAITDPYANEQQKYLKCAAREIHTWSKLNHRYVSKLLGLVQFRGQVAMVSHWAENGALPDFLARRPDVNRPRLCMQIADGLAFLHEHNIIHGDMKGANILISNDDEPLLADFGNAILQDRTLQFTYTTSRSSFSLRWTAPELLEEAPCSFKADIYALGMTILEIITGSVPYAGMKDVSVINCINKKQRPKRPEEFIPTTSRDGDLLWSTLSACWTYAHMFRPTAEAVRDVMKQITPEGLVPAEGITGLKLES